MSDVTLQSIRPRPLDNSKFKPLFTSDEGIHLIVLRVSRLVSFVPLMSFDRGAFLAEACWAVLSLARLDSVDADGTRMGTDLIDRGPFTYRPERAGCRVVQ